MNITWLAPDNLEFPRTADALHEPNGLLAVGGDLHQLRLVAAYERGIFPWYEEGQPILWWTPNPRAVIFPDQLHCSRSLKKTLRSGQFSVSVDVNFAKVIDQCRGLRQYRQGTWITDDIQRAYTGLHLAGYAHSVEVWQAENLVGGLYGVALGKVFYGESMFSLVSNASKLALVTLCHVLRGKGFELLDCQVSSEHLASMGAKQISRDEFMNLLHRLVQPPYQRELWALPGTFVSTKALQ